MDAAEQDINQQDVINVWKFIQYWSHGSRGRDSVTSDEIYHPDGYTRAAAS
jgi:hypothetical protein